MNNKLTLKIRKEEVRDFIDVSNVIEEAFRDAEHTDHNEHNLVRKLRTSSAFNPELSIVALDGEKIIGHILFTEIKIGEDTSLALAPLAVLPEYQGKGIGRVLIEEGHKKAKEEGYKSVIVLGHPEYYPKFGYKPATNWGVKAPFDVPNESFMAIELVKEGLVGVSGIVEYAKEFFE